MTNARAPAVASESAQAVVSSVPDDLVEVARVSGAHGIRGWIKIQPFAVDSTVLESVKQWWLSPPGKTLDKTLAEHHAAAMPSHVGSTFKKVDVAWTKVHGSTWLACVRGLYDRDAAHALKAYSVWVSRKDFPALDDDEFYWIDLVGCEVVSVDAQEQGGDARSGSRLGIVDSVEENPAHPLLSVVRQQQGPDGQWTSLLNARQKPVMTLIPFVAAHVKQVDLKQRCIVVDWPADF